MSSRIYLNNSLFDVFIAWFPFYKHIRFLIIRFYFRSIPSTLTIFFWLLYYNLSNILQPICFVFCWLVGRSIVCFGVMLSILLFTQRFILIKHSRAHVSFKYENRLWYCFVHTRFTRHVFDANIFVNIFEFENTHYTSRNLNGNTHWASLPLKRRRSPSLFVLRNILLFCLNRWNNTCGERNRRIRQIQKQQWIKYIDSTKQNIMIFYECIKQ